MSDNAETAPGGHSHLSPRLTKHGRFLSFCQDYSLSIFDSYPRVCSRRQTGTWISGCVKFCDSTNFTRPIFVSGLERPLEKFFGQLLALRRKLLDATRHFLPQGEQIRRIPRKRANINDHTLHAFIRKFNSSELF